MGKEQLKVELTYETEEVQEAVDELVNGFAGYAITAANLRISLDTNFYLIKSDLASFKQCDGLTSSQLKSELDEKFDYGFSLISVLRWYTLNDYEDEEKQLTDLERDYLETFYGN